MGRALVGGGALVLLFVAYQLWGTGLHEARAQDSLRRAFTKVTEATSPATIPSPPVPGDAVAMLRIPAIGVDKAIVEGVGVPDLRKGPGHYPQTPLPGQPGNAAIAGHRTTYGAPFYRLDQLTAGDEILVTTRQGDFRYLVDGSKVVPPSDVGVLGPLPGSRLTLTTCNPRYSARQRLVVTATLAGPPAPPTPTPAVVDEEAASLGAGGDPAARAPAIVWALVAALVAVAAWALGRAWRPRPAYALATPLFLAALLFCFEHLARVLPSGF